MSSVQYLREYIGERLTAAAAEIFSEFEKTILRYEEEMERQRRLLDLCWKPELKLHRVDVQQRPTPTTDQERRSGSDQEELKPPQIKEEEEQELCTNQEEDQLQLKQEADTFTVSSHEEPDQDLISLRPEDQDLGSNENTEGPPENMYVGTFSGDSPLMRVCPVRNLNRVKRQHCCPVCDKKYSARKNLAIHMRSHTGERPFSCQTCGESFIRAERLRYHMRVHPGQDSDAWRHLCFTCGKTFFTRNDLSVHTRSHTGEKPFPCRFCGKRFSIRGNCNVHMRIHTGEKPFSCPTCGQGFTSNASLKFHTKGHSEGAGATLHNSGETSK